MRIVIAPDAYKGSLSATKVAESMAKGVHQACPHAEMVQHPLADGGEGTADLLIDHFQAIRHKVDVQGPLGEKRKVSYGMARGNIAIFDVASVVGLPLVPAAQRNPLYTSTYGIGQLILDALDKGVRSFIVGLGGTSTNDGGIGMLQALGVRLLDQFGSPILPQGRSLQDLATIELTSLDARLKNCTFTVMTDVTSPLLGEHGATYVYGRQKGATEDILQQLEAGMTHYAQMIQAQLGVELTSLVGGGAAGGLGAAFYTFLDATIQGGVHYMIEITELEREIAQADVVLTGEGKIDDQTLAGKVPFGVAQIAKKYDVPVIAIVGANELTTNNLEATGMQAIFPITQRPLPLEEARPYTASFIERTTENVLRLLLTRR